MVSFAILEVLSLGRVGKCSYIFHNTYVASSASVVGPKENIGPISNYFDHHYDDLYCNLKKNYKESKDFKKNNSFEKAEIQMIKDAINLAQKKIYLNDESCNVCLGGDLNNQLATTNYALRDFNIPYIGAFAACSTITLNMFLGTLIIENSGGNAICVSSSHNATAERQFRYPNEYGVQRANTYTTTVTGAGVIILSNNKTTIKVTRATLGKVIDCKATDIQDMGSAMAPAAYATIKQHLLDFNLQISDYDLICTGDLSYYGSKLLANLFKEDGIDISKNHRDAGLIIYDRQNQDVMAGGSGCGCISVVLASYIMSKLKDKEYKKVLVCATGALMNPIMMSQKESIPSICHAITLEVT